MAGETATTDNTPNVGGYGYASDEVKVSPFNFGLNAGVTRLVKFEWIPNGGTEGAEQEALDIVFNINGTEKSYRQFPLVKAFGKNNEEITDPSAPEFKEAQVDANSRITHILHCFVETDVIKTAMARPIASFKEYCQIAASILPKNFSEILLDIFLQYGWELGDKERTYLDIPKKMKYGRWLSPALAGTWTKVQVENPTEDTKDALYYTNEKGDKHTFIKNGWFMLSKFAHQQRAGGTDTNTNSGAAAMNSTASTDAQAAAAKSAW